MDNLLDIDTFVEKALSHPESYFYFLLESILEQPIQTVRHHLKRSDILEEGEAWLNEMEQFQGDNKQRLVFEDTLQTAVNRLNQEQKTIKADLLNIKKILIYLNNLKIKFLSKKEQFSNEIDAKIILLEGYELSLQLKLTNVLQRKKLYNLLLLKL